MADPTLHEILIYLGYTDFGIINPDRSVFGKYIAIELDRFRPNLIRGGLVPEAFKAKGIEYHPDWYVRYNKPCERVREIDRD